MERAPRALLLFGEPDAHPRSPASGGELCAGLSSFITALIVMP
jgi:hypothetical protein